ncbi:hypothetical protein E2562_035957 [Oryza meyeriana var. granulata]|uniref:Uncharacterized protein n=1 Tax=Oryza meyeriana var. granulata TaxID=110450 RepID=A0A6G1F1T7_9ORYZ|nr:hypothetical protein E2562_035957 [Oryza meyeriana var. granulata]
MAGAPAFPQLRRRLHHLAGATTPSSAAPSRAGSPRPHHRLCRIEQHLGIPLLDANRRRSAAVVFNPRSSPSPPRRRAPYRCCSVLVHRRPSPTTVGLRAAAAAPLFCYVVLPHWTPSSRHGPPLPSPAPQAAVSVVIFASRW